MLWSISRDVCCPFSSSLLQVDDILQPLKPYSPSTKRRTLPDKRGDADIGRGATGLFQMVDFHPQSSRAPLPLHDPKCQTQLTSGEGEGRTAAQCCTCAQHRSICEDMQSQTQLRESRFPHARPGRPVIFIYTPGLPHVIVNCTYA